MAKLLNQGEQVELHVRTHPKALVVPGLVLLVTLGVAGYLSALAGGTGSAGVWRLVVWALAGVLLLSFVVWPALVWLSATYTLTNRRLITRRGVLTRRGHDIPLNRISEVSYEKSLSDRLLGCGSLVVSDASEQGRVLLPDIPHVERVQLVISDLVFGDGGRGGPRNTWNRDDGT